MLTGLFYLINTPFLLSAQLFPLLFPPRLIGMASTNLPSRADYVIVGGGTAGLVVACRLSESPDTSVVVLEGAPDRTKYPKVQDPGAWHSLSGSDLDWKCRIVPQVRLAHE